ncbi:hypothetical protein AVL48_37065 [Amycolatopsis regifaucium]|uniref:Uncharacterized protein n=1 Tax=Amycolatopsis regifaucium TaxID=546365 RepID=A0A154MFJ6_9PSEU|nr:hypothetical protein AVL48_37065 [Amycolatopsis regifaucium]OKA11347.1 hypothetical protein ATP06_0200320 [Amycolatopsis regifaucium]
MTAELGVAPDWNAVVFRSGALVFVLVFGIAAEVTADAGVIRRYFPAGRFLALGKTKSTLSPKMCRSRRRDG